MTQREWVIHDNGNFYAHTGEAVATLPPGCYVPMHTNRGLALQPQPIVTDTLVPLPHSISAHVVDEIAQFATLRAAFTARGLVFKRGVLLYGPPGSGKTCTIRELIALITRSRGTVLGGVALVVGDPDYIAPALRAIRTIEPSRQIVVIMEDLEELIETHGESVLLSLLDGETQVDNVVFVATTNYIDRLDARITARPSRFDLVAYVGMPDADARRAYFAHREPTLPADTIAAMVGVTDGLSIAHCRELIILTQCFGLAIEAAAARLRATPKGDAPCTTS